MNIGSGAVFGGRYVLGDRIAVGGMGEVWRAEDQVLGRTVAIKLLSPALADQAGFAQRFREEARHTAALGHPNIAQVYDYGENDGAHWLVMEFVRGKPLSQILREEGPLPPERTVAIVSQAAEALQAAHDAGVIHRDVKPANILVRPDGVVKLTDFGIARAKDASPITRTGEVMGTAQYISPEQAMGRPVSPASDVYALGCVTFEALAGRRPFDEGSAVATAMAHVHNPPPSLPASVPAPLAQVVAACLAKDPAQRPVSAHAVAQSLRTGSTAGLGAGVATQRIPESNETQAMTSPTAYAAAGFAAQTPPQGYGAQPTAQHAPAYASTAAEPSRRAKGSGAWLVPVLLLLLVGAGLGVAYLTGVLGGGSDNPTPGPAITTTVTTGSDTVDIDPNDYIGLGSVTASNRLKELGLNVQIDRVDSSEPRGRVVEINPTGPVEKGSTVTLKVSRGPSETTTTTTTTTTTSRPTSESPTSDGPTSDSPTSDTGSPSGPASPTTDDSPATTNAPTTTRTRTRNPSPPDTQPDSPRNTGTGGTDARDSTTDQSGTTDEATAPTDTGPAGAG